MGRTSQPRQMVSRQDFGSPLFHWRDVVAAPARVARLSSGRFPAEPHAENLWIVARRVHDQACLEEVFQGG